MPDRDPFRLAFRGRFTSLLAWEQLDAFWKVLQSRPAGWYLYAVGEALPTRPASPEETRHFIVAVDKLLREDHREDYCGIVYTDSLEQPTLIKIFDPHNLGVSCGFSTNPPLPGWVMSRLPPSLLEDRRPLPANRQRWWRSLWDQSPGPETRKEARG
jgi:hypothetical protein